MVPVVFLIAAITYACPDVIDIAIAEPTMSTVPSFFPIHAVMKARPTCSREVMSFAATGNIFRLLQPVFIAVRISRSQQACALR
ncbi:MAG: hypothetical protein HOM58_01370 [Rhodospirillaceae bacterium]|nr:hypothetical protein [Rhodospirillaceae bacterium]MBT5047126.1 hypothetical protein [Rhodospirillaceae bacterium]